MGHDLGFTFLSIFIFPHSSPFTVWHSLSESHFLTFGTVHMLFALPGIFCQSCHFFTYPTPFIIRISAWPLLLPGSLAWPIPMYLQTWLPVCFYCTPGLKVLEYLSFYMVMSIKPRITYKINYLSPLMSQDNFLLIASSPAPGKASASI